MRLKVIRIIFFTIIFSIILRLGYWQIIQADELNAKADNQRVSSKEIVAARGNILFSDRAILASSEPAFFIYVQPKLIDKEKGPSVENIQNYKKNAARILAQTLWVDEQPVKLSSDSARVKISLEEYTEETGKVILDSLNKDLYWVSLNTKVTLEQRNKIEKLNIIGLGFENSILRFYPEGSSAAQLSGFVSSDIYGNDTGYFGLEGFYNGELKGKKGQYSVEKDALGLPILIGKFITKEAKPGKTLVTSIDRTVQYIVEKNLQKGVEKYGAKSGSVAIMDPKTGNILAMASYPSYDQSKPGEYPKESYKNPITADSYEPGSTFKVLVMAAGLNEGLVDKDTVCDNCSGPLELSGFTIRTWNNKYQDKLTMTDTIIHSDNTGMVFVAKKLGISKLYSYIKKFGFGEVTNVDLQDEQSPSLRAEGTWKEIDLATASFGQGISVTGLQVLRAVSAIANGGKLMEPHIVSEIRDTNTYQIKPRIVEQPISEEVAKKVTEMMVRAVDEGEAKFAKPKGFKIAGKTGTAQIPVAGHYDPNKTIASFVGFAPADDPKFVMLVRYVEPSSSIFGAETAAPTFFQIAKDLFVYYGIAPTERD